MAEFKAAYPFQDDVLNLPVADRDQACGWYAEHFALQEIERTESPTRRVVMARDDAKIGFAENGGDSSQDGAAILVSDILGLRDEFVERGLEIGNWRIDERDGQKFQVFFVVAPDELCFYFHEPIED